MSGLSPDDLARITDYVAGELPSADVAGTAQWVAEDPERTATVHLLRQAQQTHRKTIAARLDVERSIAAISAAIARGSAHETMNVTAGQWPGPSSTRAAVGILRRRVHRVRLIGAVLVCAIGIVWLSRLVGHQRLPGSAKASLYETAIAQQATIRLADGTRVRLAPQSRLRVEPSFGTETRTVFLMGEAYFDVGPAAHRPFIVRTAVAEARVLGTSFAVRCDTADRTAQVTVTNGKVLVTSVMSSRARMTLHTGTLGHITDSTVAWSSIDSASHYIAWTGEQLIFREASVTEVLGVLSRWYGYQFRVDDSTLAAQNLTAILDARSLPNALGTIKLLLPVELVFDGNVVTVHARHARHNSPNSRRGDGDGLSSFHSEVGR